MDIDVIDVLEYLMSIEKSDIPRLFAAGAAYVRLQNKFKGAVLCLRTGLHFETRERAEKIKVIWEKLKLRKRGKNL